MLDPDLVLSNLLTTFRSIPALVSEMADDSSNIFGHYYLAGEENSLVRVLSQMTSPSICVAYLDLLGGNFDGSTIWKHRLEVYIRPKNSAMGGVGSPSGPRASSPPHLWWLMMNSPVLGGTLNIRQVSLMSGSLMPMETPTLVHRQDEQGLDFFVGSMVIPEYGDS